MCASHHAIPKNRRPPNSGEENARCGYIHDLSLFQACSWLVGRTTGQINSACSYFLIGLRPDSVGGQPRHKTQDKNNLLQKELSSVPWIFRQLTTRRAALLLNKKTVDNGRIIPAINQSDPLEEPYGQRQWRRPQTISLVHLALLRRENVLQEKHRVVGQSFCKLHFK